MLIAFLVASMLVAWTAVYFAVIRPKLKEFKATAGIYAALSEFEHNLFSKVALRLKGSKVAITGFVVSLAPVIGTVLESLSGIKWDVIFPTEKAAVIAGVVGFLVAVGPILMVILHMLGIADAAATVPKVAEPEE